MKVVEIRHAGNKTAVNKRKVVNLEMGLPVGKIMEEVEHELLHMDDELADEVDDNMELADEL